MKLTKKVQLRVNLTILACAEGTDFLPFTPTGILLDPSFFTKLENDFEDNIISFIIGHELSHIKNNDHAKITAVHIITNVALLAISLFMMGGFSFWFLLAIQVVNLSIDCTFSPFLETRADLEAVTFQVPKDQKLVKNGGICFFENMQRYNLNNSTIYRIMRFTSEGDDRFDFMHPFLSTRIQNLNRISL